MAGSKSSTIGVHSMTASLLDFTRNAITGDSVHVLAEAFLASHPILPSAIGRFASPP